MNGIILFDGECNFCNSSVQFIIKRDKKAYFTFTSLQSEIGKTYRKQFSIPKDVDSLILIEGGHCYMKSSAALRICKKLDGGWKILSSFLLIPSPLRNVCYDVIAKNRYKWFGKQERCMLPSPEIKKRFL